jgi:Flp pilus assembly protein TadD
MKLCNRWILPPLLLAIGVWCLSLRNGFVWDDHILIERNVSTLSQASVAQAFSSDFWTTEGEAGQSNYYRPIVTLSYMLDYSLFGLSAWGYHLTNIALHAANVALVFLIVAALIGAGPLAAAAAALFAVHPALAESAAWISGRTDLIATAWMLLSCAAYLRANTSAQKRAAWLALSLLGYAAALFSKESALFTPVVALVLVSATRKPFTLFTPSAPRALLPYGVVGLVWLIARSTALESPVGASSGQGISTDLGLLSLLHVWGNLLWPPAFRIEYGASLTAHTIAFGAACGVAVVATLAAITLSKRDSSAARALAAAALIAFAPSVMAVLLKSMIGVRLVYTSASFAIPACVIALHTRIPSRAFAALLPTLIATSSALAIVRIPLWTSDRVLFEQALRQPDASSRNHLNLGIALYNDGDLTGALAHLERPIEAAAADQQHYMLALLYTGAQCETLAETEYRLALAAKPSSYCAAHNLSGLLVLQGKSSAAREILSAFASHYPAYRSQVLKQLALFDKLSPQPQRPAIDKPWCSDRKALDELLSSAVPLNRIAGELLRGQQLEMAEVFIKASLRADPSLVAAQLNLAQLQAMRGATEQALATLQEILKQHPDEARAQQLLQRLRVGNRGSA